MSLHHGEVVINNRARTMHYSLFTKQSRYSRYTSIPATATTGRAAGGQWVAHVTDGEARVGRPPASSGPSNREIY